MWLWNSGVYKLLMASESENVRAMGLYNENREWWGGELWIGKLGMESCE